jgi:hypothetical protein
MAQLFGLEKTSLARVTKKLTKLQRLALVLVAPIRQHTPTAGLEVVYGLPPLELGKTAANSDTSIGFAQLHATYQTTISSIDVLIMDGTINSPHTLVMDWTLPEPPASFAIQTA